MSSWPVMLSGSSPLLNVSMMRPTVMPSRNSIDTVAVSNAIETSLMESRRLASTMSEASMPATSAMNMVRRTHTATENLVGLV